VSLVLGCGGSSSDQPTDDDGGVGDDTAPSNDEGVDTTPPPVTPSNQVDLLFVVDNSQSMGDKQSLFAKASARIIQELTAPTGGSRTGIAALHVGVITSSLGSYGTSACDPSNPHNNDQGHLLPRDGENASSGWKIGSGGTVTSSPCLSPVAASPIAWTPGDTP